MDLVFLYPFFIVYGVSVCVSALFVCGLASRECWFCRDLRASWGGVIFSGDDLLSYCSVTAGHVGRCEMGFEEGVEE